MTLHPKNEWLIPEETLRVARAAFPKGNVYMMMRDQLGQLYYDQDFQTLFRADCGQSALSPGQLALITMGALLQG
jgi:transposase